MKRLLAMAMLGTSLLAVSLPSHAFFSWLTRDTYTETRYPVVLVHGLFGFDRIAGVDYWYRIPQELRRSGATVYVTQVAAAGDTEVRGEQLARQVENILAISGAPRVNLIGHSHGSPTARYVASVYPGMVASVTSVGGANQGSPVADIMQGAGNSIPLGNEVIGTIGNSLSGLINLLSGGGYDQDINAAMAALTTRGSAEFTARHPQGMPTRYCGHGAPVGNNGVRYYSWTGTSKLTNVLDISDPFLAGLALAFLFEPNDGLVSRCSARLGQVIRENYRMNHLDEVNQVLGLRHLFETNPTTVYRQHANRLKSQGL